MPRRRRSIGGLGFQDCGRLSRQVVIDGIEDDEVLMELFIEAAGRPS